MIRIAPINLLPPDVWEWPPGAQPPYCLWPCSRGCRPTSKITIWRMQVSWRVQHLDARTGQPVCCTVIAGWSEDWFMDQYGCSTTGPPDFTQPGRATFAKIAVDPLGLGDVSHAWAVLRPHLMAAGADAPGTITMLPTVEAILGELVKAQAHFA